MPTVSSDTERPGSFAAESAPPPFVPGRELVGLHKDAILELAARYYASNLLLFGSAARGEDKPGSDIDIMCDFGPEPDSLDIVRFGLELEDLLGRPVDVVEARSLRGRVAPGALHDAVPL